MVADLEWEESWSTSDIVVGANRMHTAMEPQLASNSGLLHSVSLSVREHHQLLQTCTSKNELCH